MAFACRGIVGAKNTMVAFKARQVFRISVIDDHLPPRITAKYKTTMIRIRISVLELESNLRLSCPSQISLRNKYPDICVSMGPKEVLKLLLASFGLYKAKVPGDCLQIPIYQYGIKLVTKRFVNFVQSKGLKIIVWTINEPKEMKKLIELDVDGIITDKPKALFNMIKQNPLE